MLYILGFTSTEREKYGNSCIIKPYNTLVRFHYDFIAIALKDKHPIYQMKIKIYWIN